MDSRVVRATMSAQETMRSHAYSRQAQMSLTALNAAGRSVRLGGDSCSLGWVGVESRRTEALQRCTKQSWKCSQIRRAWARARS